MSGKYEHLYKHPSYVAPSVIRKMEEATPSAASKFGETRLRGANAAAKATGQTEMETLLEITLKNKDLYREMKDKVVYSMTGSILSHSALNKL